MTHLSPEQLVDVAEGHAPPEAVSHLDRCEACRSEADELRAVLALAARDEAPEPSPLFWDHFSARVGQAVRDEANAGSPRAMWWRWLAVPAVAAVVFLMAVALLPREAPPAPAQATAASAALVADLADAAAPDDPSWALMRQLSQDLAAEADTAALPAAPGTADRALGQLSDTERAALVSIIREEMARPSGE